MTASSGDQPGRRFRDAATTKAAILAAAQDAFSGDSYDEVGVRDIAAAARVDPALVIRYFGSKESLFAAAVLSSLGEPDFLAGDRALYGERLARMLATKEAKAGFDPTLAIIRSSLSPTTSGMIREVVDEQVIAPLAAQLGGADAEARAALLMSHVFGLFMSRLVLRNRALVTADPETLISLLQPVLQLYIVGLGAECDRDDRDDRDAV